MPHSPLLTYALYTSFLAAGIALAAVVGGTEVVSLARRTSRWVKPMVEREKALAAGLGISDRQWLVLRIGTVLAAFLLAWPVQIPLLTLGAPMLAAIVVPYLFSGRAAARRVKRERALVDWVRTVVARMRRNQGIDVILRDSGAHPPFGLEYELAPLADTSLLLDQAIVQVVTRARIPEAEMLGLTLIASRTRRQEDLIHVLDAVLLPVLEAKLEEQLDALEAMTQKRSQAVAMSAIMLVLFFALIRVDSIRRGFASVGGQLLLVLVAVTFALVLWIVSRIYGVPMSTRWDLETYRRELRAAGTV